MRNLLFTVEDCFKITGRGTVVAANRPPNLPDLKVGEKIVLIQPEGREIKTEIAGIEMVVTVSGVKKIALLIKDITKEDVPVGTEVFLKN
jgi:translation elongation factor EF-Tu-like GTPase